MSDEEVISPFEVGVLAALTLLGKAAAMNPNLNMEEFRADAKRLMEKLPQEPKWQGGTLGKHQAGLDAVLRGTERVLR